MKIKQLARADFRVGTLKAYNSTHIGCNHSGGPTAYSM